MIPEDEKNICRKPPAFSGRNGLNRASGFLSESSLKISKSPQVVSVPHSIFGARRWIVMASGIPSGIGGMGIPCISGGSTLAPETGTPWTEGIWDLFELGWVGIDINL